MRVFKPTYTKPLPEGAKVFVCKRGKHKDKKFAKFNDAKGHTTEARLAKDGNKILLETAHWHISFEDNQGIRRHLKAYTNERASHRLADKIEELLSCQANNRQPDDELCKWLERIPAVIRDELIKWGLLDAERSAIGKPLSKHIQEFQEHLTKKERNPRHIKEVAGTLNRIFQNCAFTTWSDISAANLKDYLDGLRDNGKGISKRRYNGLLGTAKFFCRWLVKQQKAVSSPIEYLEGLDDQQTDPRHPRRVLGLNDFRRFLEAALTGQTKFGLTGYERNLIYRFTAETGLRSIDIRRLRVQDFDFTERKIVIEAGRIKNKRKSTVYLKPATAAEIQQYCKNKLRHTQVFHLTDKTSKMVRFDLTNADPVIPYVDENGEYFDFHSIRHMCASLLGMNPDTPEAVRQQAMRHKSPEMVRHYTHAFEDQQREAINALPDLTQPSKDTQRAAKTGTDDEILSKSCFRCAPIRSNAESNGKQTALSIQQTPLCDDNKGAEQSTEPKVRGSSPLRRS